MINIASSKCFSPCRTKQLLIFFPLFFFVLSILALSAASLASAEEQVPSQLAQNKALREQANQVQERLNNAQTMTFTFTQISWVSRRPREGSGSAVFMRTTARNSSDQSGKSNPGLIMRWNYDSPDKQIIVNDGKELSLYSAKDQQVIITSTEMIDTDITYALFSGSKPLAELFAITEPSQRFVFSLPDHQLQALQLLPKDPQSRLKRVHIWYDENFLLRRLVFEDHFDALTEILFANIEINTLPATAEQRAKLTFIDLPQGTEVIRQ